MTRRWYRRSPISALLVPAALAYSGLVRLRRLLYRLAILQSVRLSAPVIIVGNLTVGGTGKTPLVLWIAAELRRMGMRPGILCRGYGGAATSPQEVMPGDDPALVGDEPLLLAVRSGCPVWVGRDRTAAGMALLGRHAQCNVIICDDGLQHYRLKRDIEIAVEDDRGHGNGLLLPAGPLREPAGRHVDVLVVNSEPSHAGAPVRRHSERPLAGATTFNMHLRPSRFYFVHSPDREARAEDLAQAKLHAVAGIGNPQRFFSLLERLGLRPVCHAFADHHRYVVSDLDFVDCDLVIMTEKDAVKCSRFGRTDLIALQVDAVPEPGLSTLLTHKLHGLATA